MDSRKAGFGFTGGWLWIYGRLALDSQKLFLIYGKLLWEVQKAVLEVTKA